MWCLSERGNDEAFGSRDHLPCLATGAVGCPEGVYTWISPVGMNGKGSGSFSVGFAASGFGTKPPIR